ncbi:MAG: YicC/YloC family endoribonuclease [Alphaproteobacteria bacterium]
MTIASMTGFARGEGSHADRRWVWEIKSVNGRGLDVRCRLGGDSEHLEIAVRERLGQHFKRGSFNINLAVHRDEASIPLSINTELLNRILALRAELAGKIDDKPPSLEALLGVRGVLENVDEAMSEEARATFDAALLASLAPVLAALTSARAGEGKRLEQVINAQLDEIEKRVAEAAGLAATQPAALKARMAEQLALLLESGRAVPEERVAQELALLATRADVREELDRLAAHISAARDLMRAKEPIGRKFDFLCQEFNREANTLCSKSVDVDLTRVGLALKAVIEQMREQVQNVE